MTGDCALRPLVGAGGELGSADWRATLDLARRQIAAYLAGRAERRRQRIEIGRLLIRARARTPHGAWEPALRAAGIDGRVARRCMREADQAEVHRTGRPLSDGPARHGQRLLAGPAGHTRAGTHSHSPQLRAQYEGKPSKRTDCPEVSGACAGDGLQDFANTKAAAPRPTGSPQGAHRGRGDRQGWCDRGEGEGEGGAHEQVRATHAPVAGRERPLASQMLLSAIYEQAEGLRRRAVADVEWILDAAREGTLGAAGVAGEVAQRAAATRDVLRELGGVFSGVRDV